MSINKTFFSHWTLVDRISLCIFLSICFIGIFASLIVGEGSLIQYDPNQSIDGAYYAPPLHYQNQDAPIHWLGTDGIGRDVASRLVYGTRTALVIGLSTVFISFLIALVLGIASGYFGNKTFRINLIQCALLLCCLPIILFYWLQPIGLIFKLLFSIILIALIYFARLSSVRSLYIPLDTIIVKAIEIFKTIPALFIVLSMFAIISKPSIINVILILGLISWPGKTRILRAEILKAKENNYLKAARVLGLNHFSIIKRHILPNVISPLLVASCFTFTSAIIAESTLSFLNVGLPHDIPSWGAMLREAKSYIPAWWLALFPGILLFLIILTLNSLIERINVN